MAISCGFFNSLYDPSGQPDRLYGAEEISRLFDGLIIDGVYEHIGNAFAVHAVEGHMAITVGSGRCWFNHTWLYNDAIIRFGLDAAYELLNRYDSVVVEIDSSVEVRNATIKIIRGEGSANPVPPTLVNNAYVHQYRLANIYVAADSDIITDSNIEYLVGRGETPYITAPLTIINADEHFRKWDAELDEFVSSKTEEADTAITTKTTELNTFIMTKTAEFDAWFDVIKDILDESTAGHLQSEIEALNKLVANLQPNLIPFPYSDRMSKTINGITFTVNVDGSVTADGTASADAIFRLSSTSEDIPKLVDGETYTMCANVEDDDCIIEMFRATPATIKIGGKATLTFTYVNSDNNTNIYIYVKSGKTVNNVVFKPILVKGTVSPTEYKRYTNPYEKPTDGIPKTDLASDVQTSLGKADTAIQSADLPNASVAQATKWNGYSIWVGTQAQYTALTSKSSQTIYFTT